MRPEAGGVWRLTLEILIRRVEPEDFGPLKGVASSKLAKHATSQHEDQTRVSTNAWRSSNGSLLESCPNTMAVKERFWSIRFVSAVCAVT
jgi:hypothetical protein